MEGGGKPSKGRIGPSAADGAAEGGALSEKELEKLAKAAEAAATKLESVRAAKAEATAAVRGLQRDASKAATAKKKLALQAESAESTRKTIEARVSRATNAGALDAAEETRQKALLKELAAIGKKREAAEAKVAEADAELASLQEQVLSIGGVRLRVQKARVDDLSENLRGVEARLSDAAAKKEGAEKAVAKLEAAVEKATKGVADLEAKIEATKGAFKTVEEAAFAVMQQVEACQAEVEQKEDALKEMQATYEEFKSVVAKVSLPTRSLGAKIACARCRHHMQAALRPAPS